MRQNGVDGDAAERPRQLDTMVGRRFDYVISLCDRVREVCPEFPDHPRRAHWSIPDPATRGDAEEASYPAFQTPASSESITSEVFDQYVGVRVPLAPGPVEGFEPDARHLGRYERAGMAIDVARELTQGDARLTMTYEATGDRVAFAEEPVQEYELQPAPSGDRSSPRTHPGQPWAPITFTRRVDGTPHLSPAAA
jgi:hypothetical protein